MGNKIEKRRNVYPALDVSNPIVQNQLRKKSDVPNMFHGISTRTWAVRRVDQ
jgi:hypothetical protein